MPPTQSYRMHQVDSRLMPIADIGDKRNTDGSGSI